MSKRRKVTITVYVETDDEYRRWQLICRDYGGWLESEPVEDEPSGVTFVDCHLIDTPNP